PFGPEYWRARLRHAIDARARLALDPSTDAYRLVYSESDGFPGLIVDRYGDYLVVQITTRAMAERKDLLVSLLAEELKPVGIWHRGDPDMEEKEGFVLEDGLLHGEAPPLETIVRERGFEYLVDLRAGHKTGFYLDQRENRARVAPFVGAGEVLDGFAHSGGFSVHAMAAGAERVVLVDSSAPSLALARRNLDRAGFPIPEEDLIAANCFQMFRRFRDEGRSFDAVIIDPPKLAPTRSRVKSAIRAYKDINLLGVKLVRPGGYLATFSCSGAVDAAAFQEMIFHAALDSGRDLKIVERLAQPLDHPVSVTFPESQYLNGLVCRVE
ncbi:MAG: class I SAM-dependent rRNA methyltransferase, partial [Planctomycetes bacterium]|nr:class I SAM-dependent rRNA methyltransferase [Planctomycetota bacterium]